MRNQKYNKLYESTVKDVKAGDKALENRYKEDLAEQKETYEKTPSDFMTAITNESSGDYLLYKPENYLLVKQILIKYLPADKTKVETTGPKQDGSDKIIQFSCDFVQSNKIVTPLPRHPPCGGCGLKYDIAMCNDFEYFVTLHAEGVD